MTGLDRRLNAFRPDLADARLEGRVEAARFAAGRPARVSAPVLDLRAAPSADAGLDTQILAGDQVSVFDEAGGWAWIQAGHDGYVGYAESSGLSHEAPSPTHIVAVPRTFAYREPDMKKSVAAAHSLGGGVRVVGEAETRGTRYCLLPDGTALVGMHLVPLEVHARDYVAVAETLERTPYLWGGASALGIDCSGLVQLSMRMAGRQVPRDTDMQFATLGTPLDIGDDLQGLRRGDLVFWKGHVAIMVDEATIIHANGHSMSVLREPLRDAVDRIAYLYARPTGYRRP